MKRRWIKAGNFLEGGHDILTDTNMPNMNGLELVKSKEVKDTSKNTYYPDYN